MAFFDEVGKKISQTSQGAAQKTKNMVETTRLNGMISDEEKIINNAFLQIGQAYYDIYGENSEQPFAHLIENINESKSRITSYSEQIKQLKGIVRCSVCGGEVPYNAPFCNSCGIAMNTKVAPTTTVRVANGITCNNCGATMPSGKTFCTNCGGKIEKAASHQPPNKIIFEDVSSSPMMNTINCPSCDKELSANAVFCSGCGQRMGGNP